MTKNRFAHIKSFKDFENEKVRLYFEMRLSEKKLQIKRLKLKAYINPFRYASAFLHEITSPVFKYTKSQIMKFIEKRMESTSHKEENSSE
jgi:hypothetical protein